MLQFKSLFGFFLFCMVCVYSHAQTIPVGTPGIEEILRRNQISGKGDQNISFTIRPFYAMDKLNADSLFKPNHSTGKPENPRVQYSKGKWIFKFLPLTIYQQYNSHQPYGWNDGAMISARGYQQNIRAGIYTKLGPVSFQLQPEWVLAQNQNFPTFPGSHSDSIWKSYYNVLNRIDAPEKFGTRPYSKIFPGQSSIRLNFRKISAGLSTENLWWGPGIRNSLIMSNNAPGFRHLSFNTTSPVKSGIGTFEWQLIAGVLENSGIFPPDTSRLFQGQSLYRPKTEDSRYLNGMIITWQPKWTKGLHLGFQRVFYQYKSTRQSTFDGYLPVLSKFFKKNTREEDLLGRDQLLSIFARLIMAESGAEVYAEYGRNDHAYNFLDLVLEPDHASAFIAGLRKIFNMPRQNDVELFMEFTHLQNPPTRNLRALEGWYTHYQVRHGYTNLGQVIGAGIGPGGNSQTTGVNWINAKKKLGLVMERVVHNNDFYYEAFEPQMDFGSHWVDVSVNFNGCWTRKNIIYTPGITLIKSFNYEWQKGINRNNLNLNFSMSYMF